MSAGVSEAMAKFFVEEAQAATCLTILDDRTGQRIVVEADELDELRKKVNFAIRNIKLYQNGTRPVPGDESCWVVVERDGGILSPCLKPRDKCPHADNNNFEIPVQPGPCIIPARMLKRAKNEPGAPAMGVVKAEPGSYPESAS